DVFFRITEKEGQKWKNKGIENVISARCYRTLFSLSYFNKNEFALAAIYNSGPTSYAAGPFLIMPRG
ncbi:TPA: hypothetical protein ACJ2XA_004517, partial [Kluyvera georgiana]